MVEEVYQAGRNVCISECDAKLMGVWRERFQE